MSGRFIQVAIRPDTPIEVIHYID